MIFQEFYRLFIQLPFYTAINVGNKKNPSRHKIYDRFEILLHIAIYIIDFLMMAHYFTTITYFVEEIFLRSWRHSI